MKYSIIFSALVVLFSCDSRISRKLDVVEDVATRKSEITYHKTHELKKADAPFSDVVQVGNLYFLAGQIGIDHTTRTLVEGGTKAETKQSIDNIESVLKQHDLELKDVVKATVILKNIDDFSRFNEIYKNRFPQKPARTTFAASGLAAGAQIEIEVMAAKN